MDQQNSTAIPKATLQDELIFVQLLILCVVKKTLLKHLKNKCTLYTTQLVLYIQYQSPPSVKSTI